MAVRMAALDDIFRMGHDRPEWRSIRLIAMPRKRLDPLDDLRPAGAEFIAGGVPEGRS